MFFEFVVQSLPYYLLILFCIFIFNIYDQKKATKIAFLFIFIFSAIRYDVGWDYWNYRLPIEQNDMSSILRFEYIERLFAIISYELNFPQLFFIINAFFTTLFIYLGVEKMSNNKYFSLLFYLCMPLFYLSSFSIIRFSLAASLIFWGYFFLKERKVFKFLMMVFISFFIHKSSLISLLLIPMFYFPLKRSINIFLFIIVVFISSSQFMSFLLNNQFINSILLLIESDSSFRYYAGSATLTGGGMSRIPIIFYMINVFNIFFYDKLKAVLNNTKLFDAYFTIFNIGCCIMLLFKDNATLSSRLSFYFLTVILLIIPLYLQIYNSKYKSVIKLIMTIFLLVLFTYQISIPNYNGSNPNRWSTYLPYRINII
ncbi:MAG: EpsG family protein [Bacteroidales bacterium]|nr:EpsG family protein [Bacteroidales bacterium]